MNALIKYPRTMHLPWSASLTDDDKMIKTMQAFEGREVIVTEKMDGENTTLYRDNFHARSLDSRHHVSRDYVKSFWASIRNCIPEGHRVCGENVYAQHSIGYTDLPAYFLGFSMWFEDFCLSWDDTLEEFAAIGITPVKTLYRGIYDEKIIKRLWTPESKSEGYVLRITDEFYLQQFPLLVAKFVRPNHVQTNKHWSSQTVIPNKLAK
jgi:hypothetical protein